MEISRQCCRLCLSVSEFNVSLFGSYCRKTNMLDKILVCLKLVVEETDYLNTICYRCAESVERHYDFIVSIRKSQTRFGSDAKLRQNAPNVKRHVTSYVREQVIDADYTFSFLESNEDKNELKSSPFFSYFSPPNVLVKEHCWKTPKSRHKVDIKHETRKDRPRQHSRDMFESQSQEDERGPEWKLTPDDNIIKRVREKCFGRSDF